MAKFSTFVGIMCTFNCCDAASGRTLLRTWTLGKHSFKATFESCSKDGAKVFLRRENGKQAQILFGKLSDADKEYLESLDGQLEEPEEVEEVDNLFKPLDLSKTETKIAGSGIKIIRYTGNQTKVSIPKEINGLPVKGIDQQAFCNCTGLTSVKIPDSVMVIGHNAFGGCTGLTSVTIPDSVTYIGHGAFNGCEGLTDVTIPDSVKKIGYNAFRGCTGLTSVTIPDSVKEIGWMAFAGCVQLSEINVAENNPSYQSVAGVLFTKDGKKLVTYPCGAAKEYLIPDGVTTIDIYAFSDCTGLTCVKIPGNVTKIFSWAFKGCTQLSEIKVSQRNPNFKSVAGVLFTKDGKILLAYPCGAAKKYQIPDNVTYIAAGAFASCEDLTRVKIPDSVTHIGDGAFSGCEGLTRITIPDRVTYIGREAFNGCTSLTSIKIPDRVTYIGDYAFSGCEGLTSVKIPDSVMVIGDYAFSGCEGLTRITISDRVTEIGYDVFRWCNPQIFQGVYFPTQFHEKLNFSYKRQVNHIIITKSEKVSGDLIIPDSIDKLPVKEIGKSAFDGCTGLTSVTIPDSVTRIGREAFNGCTGLTSIKIPDRVTYIGDYAFSGCEGLTSVTIPDSVTEIGVHAFSGCEGLTSVKIPDSVTEIGNYAFSGCEGLTSVKIPDSVKRIGYEAFSECERLTIQASKGSMAEEYAKKNEIPFQAVK